MTAHHRSNQVILRGPRSGDMGWVVQQHGEIYSREYGWGPHIEAVTAPEIALSILAEIVAVRRGSPLSQKQAA